MIETLPEILIGRDDLEPVVNRDEDGADDDEREGQAKIILEKPHPALVGLPGRGEKSDRAGLRRHDGEPDRAPANARIALQIMAEIMIGARLPPAVNRNREQRAEEHGVIEAAHKKIAANEVEKRDLEDETHDDREVSLAPAAEERQASLVAISSRSSDANDDP